MSTLREKYWILKTRKTICQIIRKCLKYLRYDGKLNKLPIAPLPADRVRQAAIFEIVPVSIKRLEWPLARVLETYKSHDGHIRLVKLRTKSGEILRPVARILPMEIRNYSTSTNNFPFSDSSGTVCLPDSDAAVPITPKVPVDAAIVRIPDENESPIHAGAVINEQDEKTILDASPSITPNDPRPASPLTFSDVFVPAFPLTIPDDPEPEEGDHSDPSPDKRTIKTKLGWVVKPVNRPKI
ncbi:hypothetical protein TNIN_308481 [Trichonephila inaurata madagascariensis]|uniref:DUF5641 domain-containing protein n=1 Tax=Trichonephila inaurata madagascariensis TaxID=2747483 RepID=A0A8X6M8C8_9ARAC|nr:hypothetical protein TNIN_308481 [Trichonephila inaurata madagascariensis]